MTDSDLNKLIALAMIDAQIEAHQKGGDAVEELDALADLDPAAVRKVLTGAKKKKESPRG